ncbi:biotin-dependent carboxylase-like uncharacterized protein [Knoellia remsis]|uniref:Biotin-dependent carboxylase-like uncharacterized protein n=1 Tax=Knoellia remsis TaxID=407159 RepID=A0A2T0UQV4_9MICO|nr:5-oxoprolinase/urea amidolyase family protein [Knoellia remsis]PRY60286.1 biotin-dependent carboxylase-like uncharacterized protein [Knoellia remsis]
MTRSLVVRRVGGQCLVEDLGRRGMSDIGVGRSGAADRGALRLANRLLANPDHAAAVEVGIGGLEVEVAGGAVTFCVTGAPAPVLVDGQAVGSHALVVAGAGSRIEVGMPASGLRSYLAVRGGVHVAPVLGSRSRDVLAELGPAPLAEGDVLPVGERPTEQPSVDQVAPPSFEAPATLRLVRGPRDAWVRDVELLVRGSWTASAKTNRVGMRLEGPALAHAEPGRQLPSEGAWRGAVQVPPDGDPVLFLADHPVTGGYPVVAVVVDADVDRAAQVRPGEPVRFVWARG